MACKGKSSAKKGSAKKTSKGCKGSKNLASKKIGQKLICPIFMY